MKALIESLKNIYYSLTSLQWFWNIESVSTRVAVISFLFLNTIFAILTSVILGITLNPKVITGIQQIKDQIAASYPDDLIIKHTDGVLETNAEMPVFIPMPENAKLFLTQYENLDSNQDTTSEQNAASPSEQEETSQSTESKNYLDLTELQNIIVFKQDGLTSDMDTLSTFFLINAKNVIVRDGAKNIQTMPIEKLNLPNGELTKLNLQMGLDNLGNGLHSLFIGFVIIVTIISIVISLFAKAVVYGLIGLFLVQICKSSGKDIAFSTILKILVYTLPLPIFLNFVAFLVDFTLPVPFGYDILNIVLASIIAVKSTKPTNEVKQLS